MDASCFQCLILCFVCVLWVDGPQPIRSMLGGDRDAREGWEDLLPSIRNTNLLQVFLAVLPGHACSPPREAPSYLCVCVWQRKRQKEARGRERVFSLLSFYSICREIMPSPQSSQIMSSDLCIKIRTKRTCISITSPHQSYQSKGNLQSARELCKLLYYRFKAASSCSGRVIYMHAGESALPSFSTF